MKKIRDSFNAKQKYTINRPSHFNKIYLALFGLVFAGLGTYIIINSLAATPETCDLSVNNSAALNTAIGSTANSGKTICVTANITGSRTWTTQFAAMTRVVAQPNDMTIDLGAVSFNGTKNITVEGFEMTNGGFDTVNGVQNIKLIKNYMHDMTFDGLRTSGATTNLEFSGNNVKCIAWTGDWTSGYGIRTIGGPNIGFKANYNTIDGCHNSADGMELGDIHSFEIIGNDIKNIDYHGTAENPHADVLMIWSGSSNGTIKDNKFTDSDDTLFNNTTDVLMQNNLTVRMQGICHNGGPAGDSDNTLRNFTWRQNTIYQCGKAWNSTCGLGTGWGTNPPNTSCGYGLVSGSPLASGATPSGNILDRNLLVSFDGSCAQLTSANHNLVRGGFSCIGVNQGNFTPTFYNTIDYLPTNLPTGYSDVGYRAAPVGYQAYDAANGTTTPPTPPDTTPPVINLSAPSSGATVSGTTTITANAIDNVAIASVQFKLDSANLSTADTSSPYSYNWNTSSVTNGSHTLTAIATDTSGNTTQASTVTVTINNSSADTTKPTNPTNVSAVLGGVAQVNLSWTASTDTGGSGLAGYNIFRNGTKLNSSPITGTTYGDATVLSNTSYSYSVQAVDGTGNTSTTVAASPSSITTPAPKQGDLTGDNKIDIFDLNILAKNWGKTGASITGGDLNGDGVVNVFDLNIMAKNWGK